MKGKDTVEVIYEERPHILATKRGIEPAQADQILREAKVIDLARSRPCDAIPPEEKGPSGMACPTACLQGTPAP